MIDTHVHLTDGRYHGQLQAVLQRAQQAGVDNWITVGTDVPDSRAGLELTGEFENIYCTAGVHPHESGKQEKGYVNELQKLTDNEKVVAVWEIGLDYHYDFSPRTIQQRIFQEQLELAVKVNLPVVVHCREAFDDCLGILDDWNNHEAALVFHCFAGDTKAAKLVLDRGYFVSFTGTITFGNALVSQQTAKYVPLEKVMLETDCPYLSPAPKRNQKPNEPALLVHIVEKLAELRGLSFSEIATATTENSRLFFKRLQKPQ